MRLSSEKDTKDMQTPTLTIAGLALRQHNQAESNLKPLLTFAHHKAALEVLRTSLAELLPGMPAGDTLLQQIPPWKRTAVSCALSDAFEHLNNAVGTVNLCWQDQSKAATKAQPRR
ncbi:MAG: hypothetical protein KDK99_16560 [Verrucomicrobiales bacterium]|nr:hypothetical protein [Verrucomicrobiales bacterium]